MSAREKITEQRYEISDLRRLIPQEIGKVQAKINQAQNELSTLKSLSKDINETLFEGL